jgi:3,4-dihydroxy 2-butanone 4-phosphate synthase/GTP cyclohydrolase II
MDVKDFGIGAQILHELHVSKIKLLTTKDRKIKRVGMAGYGLEIVETVNF